ncbi:MAG: RHS repeat-associated core domain-containing protein [Pseudohongiellaceae bacterium]
MNGDSSSEVHFIYDQTGQVIAEIDAGTGQTLREYVYVNGQQVALVDDPGTQDEAMYFVHNDHLGTPQKITDASRNVVWAGSYKPFGEVTETVATIENNIRFPGQYEDGESGLYYNYFRNFDFTLGRFLKSDPIGQNGGINTYLYAQSNPIHYIDKFGLNAFAAATANESTKPRGGPFGGKCGPEGSQRSTWIPDATPGACDTHDRCWLQCWKNCEGPESGCRKWCDSEFASENGFYAVFVRSRNNSTYRKGLDEYCNDC